MNERALYMVLAVCSLSAVSAAVLQHQDPVSADGPVSVDELHMYGFVEPRAGESVSEMSKLWHNDFLRIRFEEKRPPELARSSLAWYHSDGGNPGDRASGKFEAGYYQAVIRLKWESFYPDVPLNVVIEDDLALYTKEYGGVEEWMEWSPYPDQPGGKHVSKQLKDDGTIKSYVASFVSPVLHVISVENEHRILARFVATDSSAGGYVDVPARGVEGGTIEAVAVPRKGMCLDYWEVTPSLEANHSGEGAISFTMPSEDVKLVAHFATFKTLIGSVAVTVPEPVAGNTPQNAKPDGKDVNVKTVWYLQGSDTPFAQVFEEGKAYKIEVGIEARPGYRFTQPLVVTVNGKRATLGEGDIKAQTAYHVFDPSEGPKEHSITVVVDGGHGRASADAASALKDTVVRLVAEPESGYALKKWTVVAPDGLEITGNTFVMPNADVEIKATFAPSGSAHEHVWSEEWKKNEIGHWHECAECHEIRDYGTHVFSDDSDTICDTCGYERTVTAPDPAPMPKATVAGPDYSTPIATMMVVIFAITSIGSVFLISRVV